MSRQRTFVGLDVHARSVVGHALDESTGEVWRQLLPTDPPGIWGWLESLPQPVKVTYEAGPTGYGLARFLRGRGIACRVAAPSKLIRPAGNRVKTDAKDAEHLCPRTAELIIAAPRVRVFGYPARAHLSASAHRKGPIW